MVKVRNTHPQLSDGDSGVQKQTPTPLLGQQKHSNAKLNKERQTEGLTVGQSFPPDALTSELAAPLCLMAGPEVGFLGCSNGARGS